MKSVSGKKKYTDSKVSGYVWTGPQVPSLKRPAEDSVSIIKKIKKIKTVDARPVFKRKSNEEQYKASSKVLDTLEDAK